MIEVERRRFLILVLLQRLMLVKICLRVLAQQLTHNLSNTCMAVHSLSLCCSVKWTVVHCADISNPTFEQLM